MDETEPESRRHEFLWIIGFFVLLILIPASFYVIKNKTSLPFLKSSFETKPLEVEEKSVESLIAESHPKLYSVTLEYNPKTGVVTSLKTQTGNGDPVPLLADPPKNVLPGDLVYRMEVMTPQKEIVSLGWEQKYKEVIETPEGNMRFGVSTYYKPGYLIRLFLPNGERLWIGEIK